MARDVASATGIPVLEPRAADVGVLLVDDVRDVGAFFLDVVGVEDTGDARAYRDHFDVAVLRGVQGDVGDGGEVGGAVVEQRRGGGGHRRRSSGARCVSEERWVEWWLLHVYGNFCGATYTPSTFEGNRTSSGFVPL